MSGIRPYRTPLPPSFAGDEVRREFSASRPWKMPISTSLYAQGGVPMTPAGALTPLFSLQSCPCSRFTELEACRSKESSYL